jgi:hypothetical protein
MLVGSHFRLAAGRRHSLGAGGVQLSLVTWRSAKGLVPIGDFTGKVKRRLGPVTLRLAK